MKKISVFVAGAKSLDEQRRNIKALANDMTAEYVRMQQDICVNISSYDNYASCNQLELDDHIVNRADIVLFILDGRIGAKTEEEYILAAKHHAEKGTPRIFVFLHKSGTNSADEAYIDGLFKTINKDYYFTYENDYDLILKVKSVLRKTIFDICSEPQKVTSRGRLIGALRRVRWMTIAVVVLAMVCGVLCYMFTTRSPKASVVEHNRELLIIGGGSAERYIEHCYGVDIKRLPNADYLPLPSGVAWPILVEEAQGNDKRYFTLVVSADSADMTKLGLRSGDDCIVSVPLGLDTLVVYAKDDGCVRRRLSGENIEKHKISVDELRSFILNNDSVRVFTTSMLSGTHNAYERLVGSTHLASNKCAQYMKISNPDEPYILLASRHYMDNVNALPMNVYRVDAHGRETYCTKPIFLYFIAYAKHAKLDSSGSDMEYIVPDGTVELLRALGVDIDDKIRNNRVFVREDRCYLDFSELSSWE